jgi:hypothetical protein
MSRSTPSLPKIPHGERFSLCTHISFVQFSVECWVQVEPVCVEAWGYALQHLYTAHLHPIQKGRVGKTIHAFVSGSLVAGALCSVSQGFLITCCWSQEHLGLEFSIFCKCWARECFLQVLRNHNTPQATCPPRSALDAGEIRGYCEPRPICGPSGCRAI